VGEGILQWFPPDRSAASVWWFFDDGEFHGWYVNLEAPAVRWPGGVDTTDHALDLWVEPDRTWTWKDEGEFAERTGHPWYWTAAEAAGIRATGERMAARVEAGAFPFDGSWCDFTPDPQWTVPGLAAGWDRLRATEPAGAAIRVRPSGRSG
jgi:hypothetical protein